MYRVFIVSCGSNQEKIKPTEQIITESVYASDIIKGDNQYQVFSTVNGVIATIVVKEGDVVKKGARIIKLVNASAQLNSENASLSANYTATYNNAEKLEKLQIATNLAKAKINEDALLQQRQQNL